MTTAIAYSDKLKNPLWQKRRLDILERASWSCELCRDSKSPLHVHHLEYKQSREPWEYEDDELVVLCDECHKTVHVAGFSGEAVKMLVRTFRAGQRYAIYMMATHEEGSIERLNYLQALAE